MGGAPSLKAIMLPSGCKGALSPGASPTPGFPRVTLSALGRPKPEKGSFELTKPG